MRYLNWASQTSQDHSRLLLLPLQACHSTFSILDQPGGPIVLHESIGPFPDASTCERRIILLEPLSAPLILLSIVGSAQRVKIGNPPIRPEPLDRYSRRLVIALESVAV